MSSKHQKGPDLKRFMVRPPRPARGGLFFFPNCILTNPVGRMNIYPSSVRAPPDPIVPIPTPLRSPSVLSFLSPKRPPPRPRRGGCGCSGKRKDKRLKLSLNGNRKVVGTLRGYDAFLNVVLENAVDEVSGADLGGGGGGGEIVIRGNSIVQFESVERVTT